MSARESMNALSAVAHCGDVEVLCTDGEPLAETVDEAASSRRHAMTAAVMFVAPPGLAHHFDGG